MWKLDPFPCLGHGVP